MGFVLLGARTVFGAYRSTEPPREEITCAVPRAIAESSAPWPPWLDTMTCRSATGCEATTVSVAAGDSGCS